MAVKQCWIPRTDKQALVVLALAQGVTLSASIEKITGISHANVYAILRKLNQIGAVKKSISWNVSGRIGKRCHWVAVRSQLWNNRVRGLIDLAIHRLVYSQGEATYRKTARRLGKAAERERKHGDGDRGMIARPGKISQNHRA